MDALTPAEVTQYMIANGEAKAKQPYYITFFKGWMAGWIVCIGALVFQLIQGGSGTLRTDYPSLITLIGAMCFPVGLIMLVLTGQELVTAHFMFMPMALIKGRIKIWELPINWLIVFFGNLAGSLCTDAFLAHYAGLYNTDALITYSKTVAMAKTSETWGGCVLRGIGCNFLVCMAVWLGAGSREIISKIFALWFPIAVFVFCGFEHVVVNMYYVPIGMINGAPVSVGKYMGRSMIPSCIGNIIGALLLGIPMMLFYRPPELPFFHKNQSTESPAASVVAHGGETDTEVTTINGKKSHAA